MCVEPTFSPTRPMGPSSPGGPTRPLGPSGPSSPLGPGTPSSPCCHGNADTDVRRKPGNFRLTQSLNPSLRHVRCTVLVFYIF